MPKSRVAEISESNGRNDEAASNEAPSVMRPSIEIPAFNFQPIDVEIVGITPLICHAFPDKEKKRMIQSRQTDATTEEKPASTRGRKKVHAVRDFDQEYRDSLYPISDGYGFPAIAFKRAIVGACRQVSNLDMTMANRIIFVGAPYVSKGFGCVKILGEPRMREDVVRLSGIDKPPDIRYRGEFIPWKAVLPIEFNASMISLDGILRLIQFAGKCEGIGEQRPSSPKKSGDNGQFEVAHKKGL